MRARVDFREARPPARGLAAVSARPGADLVPLVLRWTVLLLPVNWICGTTPLWCYATALLLLFRARTWSALEALFLWLIAAFALGLTVGLLRGAPFDRALASVYNMTIVIVLIAFLNGAETLDAPDREAGRAPRCTAPSRGSSPSTSRWWRSSTPPQRRRGSTTSPCARSSSASPGTCRACSANTARSTWR